jgi:hypothetical protein
MPPVNFRPAAESTRLNAYVMVSLLIGARTEELRAVTGKSARSRRSSFARGRPAPIGPWSGTVHE